MLKGLFGVAMVAGFATLAASFGGALHPLGDSLAVFRLHIALGCLAVSLPGLGLQRRAALAGIAVAGFALVPPLWSTASAPGGASGPISLYQKNMLFLPRDLAPLIDDIRVASPDNLTLQEVTPGNVSLLAALSDRFPSRLICPFARVGAVAVASRWPLTGDDAICLETQGLAAIRVAGPDGPLWVVSIHLHWPWPHAQGPQRDRLLPVLQALDAPVLIGGDFNMVPWSHTLRSLARATGTRRIGQAFNSMTRFSPLLPLPIDHVLVPDGAFGTTERRPLLGSDHHGILARVGF